MIHRGPVSRAQARAYYEDFSLATGLRHWLFPNLRHQQLKLLLRALLRDGRPRRILDVGCGAGTMTSYLTRYGDVTGIDFSGPAVEAARRLAPRASFRVGSLEDLPVADRFELITLFDVLEHIPAKERPAFFGGLAARLAEHGLVFISTPYPDFTASRRARDDETLQVIDEEVRLEEILVEAGAAGLQLLSYQAFDVFAGSPEYQAMTFTTRRAPEGPPALRSGALARQARLLRSWPIGPVWRIAHALRVLRHGRVRTAWWFLTAKPPNVRS